MKAGRQISLNRINLSIVARDRDEVLAEAIAHCGDDPAAQDAKRILEGLQGNGRESGQEGGSDV